MADAPVPADMTRLQPSTNPSQIPMCLFASSISLGGINYWEKPQDVKEHRPCENLPCFYKPAKVQYYKDKSSSLTYAELEKPCCCCKPKAGNVVTVGDQAVGTIKPPDGHCCPAFCYKVPGMPDPSTIEQEQTFYHVTALLHDASGNVLFETRERADDHWYIWDCCSCSCRCTKKKKAKSKGGCCASCKNRCCSCSCPDPCAKCKACYNWCMPYCKCQPCLKACRPCAKFCAGLNRWCECRALTGCLNSCNGLFCCCEDCCNACCPCCYNCCWKEDEVFYIIESQPIFKPKGDQPVGSIDTVWYEGRALSSAINVPNATPQQQQLLSVLSYLAIHEEGKWFHAEPTDATNQYFLKSRYSRFEEVLGVLTGTATPPTMLGDAPMVINADRAPSVP